MEREWISKEEAKEYWPDADYGKMIILNEKSQEEINKSSEDFKNCIANRIGNAIAKSQYSINIDTLINVIINLQERVEKLEKFIENFLE